ncbi:TetR/AcrR family transcriptional regulator [Glacieibacterium frigidum]|uniref:TetR/AcrR family transcriptional regulator n=1 Tax=Glacieibacterium frigidum TaxID=2593303 RepID=UPI00163DB1C6|nr:TetR/AcrR family transcriptional regulator [Glacieibacterium frigidum]
MTRPVKIHREVVADALVGAFRRDGYAGASVRDLAAATGLRSASLYHRFPAKSDMAIAAVQRAGEDFAAQVVVPLTNEDRPADRLAASAEGLRRFYAGGDLSCLLAVLALSDAPPAVEAEIAALLQAWRDALAATLSRFGMVDPVAEAEDRIAAIHGALVVRQGGLGARAFARAAARMAMPR